MKKIALIVFLCLVAKTTAANEWFQTNKPVTCGPFKEIVETLTKDKFREFPLWIGRSSQDSSQFSLFYNEKTGSWTLVQYGQTTGCILGIGQSSDIVNGNFLPESRRLRF